MPGRWMRTRTLRPSPLELKGRRVPARVRQCAQFPTLRCPNKKSAYCKRKLMEYRPLGNTGIDVSVICLGTMTWGEQNTQAEAFAQMDYAFAQSVNFFDTAAVSYIVITPCRAKRRKIFLFQAYLNSEEVLGRILEGKRRDVVLASKFMRQGSTFTPFSI